MTMLFICFFSCTAALLPAGNGAIMNQLRVWPFPFTTLGYRFTGLHFKHSHFRLKEYERIYKNILATIILEIKKEKDSLN